MATTATDMAMAMVPRADIKKTEILMIPQAEEADDADQTVDTDA